MSTTTNTNENPTSTININPEDTSRQLGEKLYGPLGEWVGCDRENRSVIVIIADAVKPTSITIGRGDTLAKSLAATILIDDGFRKINNVAKYDRIEKDFGQSVRIPAPRKARNRC